MNKYYLIAGLMTITATGSLTAYMSPQEVFTDLEIPEMEEEALPADSDPQPVDEQPEEVLPVVSDPQPVNEPPEESPTTVNATEENTTPSFFRSGKTLEQNITEEPAEDPLDVFEQEPAPAPEEDVVQEDVVQEPEVIEEEIVEPETPEPVEEVEEVEEVVDEPIQKSAPQQSTFTMLLSKSRYYISGIAIIFAGGMFFLLRKKKPSAAGSTGDTIPSQTIVKPEESSPRLEQALKAMEKEGIAAAGERLKEVSDDKIAFGEPPSSNTDQ